MSRRDSRIRFWEKKDYLGPGLEYVAQVDQIYWCLSNRRRKHVVRTTHNMTLVSLFSGFLGSRSFSTCSTRALVDIQEVSNRPLARIMCARSPIWPPQSPERHGDKFSWFATRLWFLTQDNTALAIILLWEFDLFQNRGVDDRQWRRSTYNLLKVVDQKSNVGEKHPERLLCWSFDLPRDLSSFNLVTNW